MERFTVRFSGAGPRACPVCAGRGALAALEDDLAAAPPGAPLVVVSDSNVAPLHARPLCDRLRARGLPAVLLDFPAGEERKTRETKAALEDGLLSAGAGRDAAIVAVGGGVTGDLGGFTAATWHRGIPVVQVPTSLLAMTDAALGGKTAIDHPGGKNLIGAFHQPAAVYVDPAFLTTLPEPERIGGLAEAVKTATIADASLFRRLERSAAALREGDLDELEAVVVRCLRIKARVVSRDERETGRRAILNFGHTVAHAIEKASGWSIPHGPAVALGMAVEARLAREATGLPDEDGTRLEGLLASLGLSLAWPAGVDPGDVVIAARADKKNRAGRTRYALPARLGAAPRGADPTIAIEDERLLEALRERASTSAPFA